MLGPTEIVALRGNGSILLIGRRLSFGQLNRFDAKTCGSIEDPQTIADRVRCYSAYPGNGLKLRHFWMAAAGGSMVPRNDLDMARDVGRIVAQGTWMVLEIADERNLGPAVPEKMKPPMAPAFSILKGRNVATMSMDEKFQLTFDKVPNYLGEGFAETFRELVSPAALATAAVTIAVLAFASGGTIVAIILGIGYAMVGWAIFNAIGDLIEAMKLVANAKDEQTLDRAAFLFARVAAEITVGLLLALLTRVAGRAGVGGKNARQVAEETPKSLRAPVQASRQAVEAPLKVSPNRSFEKIEKSEVVESKFRPNEVESESVADKTNRANLGANNVNAGVALRQKLSALQGAQTKAARVRQLPDGRIRYYEAERAARNPGATRGASYVTEYNPKNGNVRSWNEAYDQAGNVNRVRPKMINGQNVKSLHYPPTAKELGLK
ncbi:hypothetical protein TH25_03030 [Thalassospira profundimaris]|uniref:Uncharacterized protein n=1 Tax=Thalassospira profundimaris TaxID=502049 RepID=A0A367XL53_9PROT|nr:hypothetical protein [Thalassospira profundimaris]RCK54288.1 hypothetical protein TH25_03030 [Thalassospira profundimaris]